MPYVKFDTPSDSNKTSPGGFIAYMEKEDKEKGIDKEFWFNESEDYIPSYRIMADIDNQKGLGKEEFRYYTGSISFSEEELAYLDNDYKKLKQFGKAFINEYAENFNKGLSPSDVRLYLKLESDRYYKGSDPEVLNGKRQSGEKKSGSNTHFHFIVGRKSTDEKKKLSPLSNHINTRTGAVTGGFSRDQLKERSERLFDIMFKYNRPLEQTYQHLRETSPNKEPRQRISAVTEAADKSQSILKYDLLSREEKEKKLSVFINFMQHNNKLGFNIKIDQQALLNEAKARNYNGNIYKALLNMNSRLKNGFQVSGDITPYILNYARFVDKPYGQLPDSLKEDRFMRLAQIINQKLPPDNKLNSSKLYDLEKQNHLNGNIYRAMGELNKLIRDGKSVPNAQDVVMDLIKRTPNTSISNNNSIETKHGISNNSISSLVDNLTSGNPNMASSPEGNEEREKRKKRKKRQRPTL
ncbi:DUF5712 family protein [Geofilum rhodophaeum]|uniref:DUF5712 family protein n=1 Tax=Geofilum rhodophaeum TaxID=1965019 RepID=UPI000B521837|nr:DUF5712 family protein [Geofilum rhodophaeum]